MRSLATCGYLTPRPGGIPGAWHGATGGFAARRSLPRSATDAAARRLFRVVRQFRGTHFMREGETPRKPPSAIQRPGVISTARRTVRGRGGLVRNPTFNSTRSGLGSSSRHPSGRSTERNRRRATTLRRGIVRLFKTGAQAEYRKTIGGDTLCWRTIEAGILWGAPAVACIASTDPPLLRRRPHRPGTCRMGHGAPAPLSPHG
jgi:hypothetical protein